MYMDAMRFFQRLDDFGGDCENFLDLTPTAFVESMLKK